ncbi:hypothetical protein KCP76_00975 [Salmonella enterica subsp. enterica serovar Weltevreden]|nr:hypothetical protein KCP76_00975 [Salmonella enterica subsp. enterica serovar Weltevreden]
MGAWYAKGARGRAAGRLAVFMIGVKEGEGFKTRMSPQFKTFPVSIRIKTQDWLGFVGGFTDTLHVKR